MVVEILDIPMVLVGALLDFIYANLGSYTVPPWQVGVMTALNGGGRLALSIAAAISVNIVTEKLPHRLRINP